MSAAVTTLRALLLVVFVLSWTNHVNAHSPHDVIFDVVVSPEYETDQTVFIIVSNTLAVSTDEGCTWKKLVKGIDHHSQLTRIAISPDFVNDGTLLVASENDGVFRSDDGGKSWQRANTGFKSLNIRTVRFSPGFRLNNTLAALDVAGRLYQSTDSGRTWTELTTDIKDKITCFAFLPTEDADRIAAGTDGNYIFFVDEGNGREDRITLPNGCTSMTSIVVSPYFETDSKIFVGTETCGAFEVDVGAGTATPLDTGLTDDHITTLAAAVGADSQIVLYASTYDDGFFARNGRQGVWEKQSQGLTTDPQAKDPHYLLPNFKNIATFNDTVFLGGFDGLFKSTDRGKAWIQQDTIWLNGITGLSTHAARAGTEGHKVALATYGGGAYLYDSLEQSWTTLNRGLHWTRLNDMVFSPDFETDGRIYSGSERNFLLFEAGNEMWRRIPVDIDFKRRLTGRIDGVLRKIGLGPNLRKKIHRPLPSDSLFPTVILPLPGTDAGKALFFGTRSSGIYGSDDGGATNYPLWNAGAKLVTSLDVSTGYRIDGIMAAGLYNGGVFISRDEGNSWHRADNGIPSAKQVHLAISPDFSNDQTIVAGNANGPYISTDGGGTWKDLAKNLPGEKPNVVCLAMSPGYQSDKMIIIGIYGKGLWVTNDEGRSFRPFAKALIDENYQAKFLKFSNNYREDGVIFCASSYELFRSSDRGRSWELLNRPVRYENIREEIRYSGKWKSIENDQKYSAMNASLSSTPGSGFQLRFKGTGVAWIGDRSPCHGQAKIYLDENFVDIAELKSDTNAFSAAVYTIDGLPDRCHVLTVEINCTNQSNECGAISIDAIDVIP